MSERFGAYELQERIGVGGMAEVFLARYVGVEGFEKETVIKRIRPHLGEEPAFVQMFLNEAKLAAQLSHPNIVQIYDLGKIDDAYFIAMEYVAGRDLSAFIRQSKRMNMPLPLEYSLKIVSHACEGLHYAHTKKDAAGVPLHIVHRDVSPDNIRVGWSGGVKLLDFGIAKAATVVNDTKKGQIKGKVSYMAPEQVLGEKVDSRTDVFSLGAVLYECLTGVRPFAGDSELATMNQIVDGKMYPPSYFADEIPSEVEAIVMQALARDPSKRFASAQDLQNELDRFLVQHEFTPSNVHLSNFARQLFQNEMKEEEVRRQKATTPVPRIATPRPRLVASPAPVPMMMDDEKTASLDAPSAKGFSDDRTRVDDQFLRFSEIALKLDGGDMSRLRLIAEKNGKSPEDIVHDVVTHYLKFHHARAS